MTGLETIALANAALSLFESLVPKLKELTQKGEITVEEQAELKARYERLKNNQDEVFAGSQWTKSDGSPSRSQTGQ